MKTGPLWRITVETSAEAEEALQQLLGEALGAPAIACTDLERGVVTVSVYLEQCHRPKPPQRREIDAILARVRAAGLDLGPGRVSVRSMRPENWAESWKRHFKPMEFGPRLVVQPSWSRRKPRPGQAVVILDPGLSFGTGQHPTTGFCLRQITAAVERSGSVSMLDVGCGSGILAIVAARLGCRPVEGFDFDPEAVRVARENAARNGVKFRLRRADVRGLPLRGGRRFDVVCANLMFDLLIAERRRITARVRPGGRLVLAGILDRQFSEVQSAYEALGWRLVASRREKEWRSGALVTAQA
jgi:ribosomal protein L11 methyltransferase